MAAASSPIAQLLRWVDLVVLAIALAIFVVADLPMLGYAVCAAAWIAQRLVHVAAERHTQRMLIEGNRRAAMGTVGASSLVRVWIVTLSVLLVGLLGDRESGLAAAVLAAILFTVFMACRALALMFEPQVGA